MKGNSNHVPGGGFKAKCPALTDDAVPTRKVPISTNDGKPVAKVPSVEPENPHDLRGSILREKDLVAPIEEEWDADRLPWPTLTRRLGG